MDVDTVSAYLVNHMHRPRQHRHSSDIAILAAYYATIALNVFGAFSPELRTWGFNWWAYFPATVQLVVLAFMLVLPFLLRSFGSFRRLERDITLKAQSGRQWILVSAVVIAFLAALFTMLRTQIHFLGDGYAMMANLAEGNPGIKGRNYGEALLHLWLSRTLGGSPENAALLSFRIISIGAGAMLVTLVAWFSGQLFHSLRDRLLFLFGIGSGGFMLLYFGYVEHYALLNLSFTAFCLTGIAVAERLIARWWILIPFALACLFHTAGFVLVPALLVGLLSRTGVAHRLSLVSVKTKALAVVMLIAAGVTVGVYLYETSYLVRLTIVSLYADRLTVGGYTILSHYHLIDFINLVMLLVPGLFVLLAFIFINRRKSSHQTSGSPFLLTVILCSLLAAFLFDPKLGMARDWDLLAFPGAALAAYFFYTFLRRFPSSKVVHFSLVLAIALNFAVLIPRATALNQPSIGLKHIDNYVRFDIARSRPVLKVLSDYYYRMDMKSKAAEALKLSTTHFLTTAFFDSCMELGRLGRHDLARPRLKGVIASDPTNFSAWANIGLGFLMEKQYDSAIAYHDVAQAINPYNAAVRENLSQAYFFNGDFKKSQRLWEEAIAMDNNQLSARFNLARLYLQQGRRGDGIALMSGVVKHELAPYVLIKEYGDLIIEERNYAEAADAYQRAVAKGLDSNHVYDQLGAHPDLKPYLNWPDRTESK